MTCSAKNTAGHCGRCHRAVQALAAKGRSQSPARFIPLLWHGSRVFANAVVQFRGTIGVATDEEVVFEQYECPPSICAMTDPELRSLATQDNWKARNFLNMRKVRTGDTQFNNLRDYVEYCPFAQWRTQGKWHRSKRYDENDMLQFKYVNAPYNKWVNSCLEQFPDPDGVLWTEAWWNYFSSPDSGPLVNPEEAPAWIPRYHVD